MATEETPSTSDTGSKEKQKSKAKSAGKANSAKNAKSASEALPYAIVRLAGQQLMVSAGQKVTVNRMTGNPGDAVNLDQVLLLSTTQGALTNGGNTVAPIIGAPLVQGASVKAKIVAHQRGKKVIIYKKKRRTGYTKNQGHRQELTTLLIEEIVASR